MSLLPRTGTEKDLSFLWLGRVDYGRALRIQEEFLGRRLRGMVGDRVLFLEHPHTITGGKREVDPPGILKDLGIPFYRVSRGGLLTYHGPGQLVLYPIIKLSPYRLTIRRYVHLLEEVVIRTLSTFAIPSSRREGLPGVWVEGRKIASLGIGVRRGVTYHGVALNVFTDLSYFRIIEPCGLKGDVMTSMRELGVETSLKEVAMRMGPIFRDLLTRTCRRQ